MQRTGVQSLAPMLGSWKTLSGWLTPVQRDLIHFSGFHGYLHTCTCTQLKLKMKSCFKPWSRKLITDLKQSTCYLMKNQARDLLLSVLREPTNNVKDTLPLEMPSESLLLCLPFLEVTRTQSWGSFLERTCLRSPCCPCLASLGWADRLKQYWDG